MDLRQDLKIAFHSRPPWHLPELGQFYREELRGNVVSKCAKADRPIHTDSRLYLLPVVPLLHIGLKGVNVWAVFIYIIAVLSLNVSRFVCTLTFRLFFLRGSVTKKLNHNDRGSCKTLTSETDAQVS